MLKISLQFFGGRGGGGGGRTGASGGGGGIAQANPNVQQTYSQLEQEVKAQFGPEYSLEVASVQRNGTGATLYLNHNGNRLSTRMAYINSASPTGNTWIVVRGKTRKSVRTAINNI